jgi:hypothetical protein
LSLEDDESIPAVHDGIITRDELVHDLLLLGFQIVREEHIFESSYLSRE